MVFHGDYEEALDNWESRNLPCPVDIRVGDLVRPKDGWTGFDTMGVYAESIGIVTDVYKVTHEQTQQSYWCCKIYMDGAEQCLPISNFELVERK